MGLNIITKVRLESSVMVPFFLFLTVGCFHEGYEKRVWGVVEEFVICKELTTRGYIPYNKGGKMICPQLVIFTE